MRFVQLFNGIGAICLVFLLSAITFDQSHAESDLTRVLVLGDSLTAGYGLSEAEAFPAQLETALQARGHDIRVINAGVSGDTTAGGRARLEWSLAADPHAVIVALGSNDGLRGLEPSATRANLLAILERLEAGSVPVLLAGALAPRNLGEDYAQEFDAVFAEAAERHDALFYPFFLEGVALDPALNQPDGIHPNAKGVRRMVEGILPLTEELLERVRAAAASKEAGQ